MDPLLGQHNFTQIGYSYFENLISEVPGLKAFIMDSETIQIISMIYPKNELIIKEIVLIENISKIENDKFAHMNSIYFVRPTSENIQLISNHLKNQLFGEFYIYFSNRISNQELTFLADADIKSHVKQVKVFIKKEIYLDYFPIAPHAFSFNISSVVNLYKNPDPITIGRIVEGLYALLLSKRLRVNIRFLESSPISGKLAEKLAVIIN